MKKSVIGIVIFMTITLSARTQDKLYTKTGKIRIVAVESDHVEATTRSAVALLDTKTGHLDFTLLVKSFEFKKALMQEKFNQQILETDKYPQAIFKGEISNNNSVNYQKPGEYAVDVSGKLTLHGITHDITTKGKISIAASGFKATAKFNILLPDYQISNPGVGDKIEINIDCNLEALK